MRTFLAITAFALMLGQAHAQAPESKPAKPARESGITVPGVIDRPVPTPPGDPRTVRERMRDIRSWDKCVLRAQAHTQTDPLRPQMDTPEDYCRERLGMASRTAIPADRD